MTRFPERVPFEAAPRLRVSGEPGKLRCPGTEQNLLDTKEEPL